jgi:hypothetical protein
VTGRVGDTVLELGLPAHGPGYAALEDVLLAILGGRVRHGGALLARFGIRYVVAGARDLPAETVARLSEQLDLDLIQTAGGLSIYEAPAPLPLAAAVGPEAAGAAASSGIGPSVEVARAEHAALSRASDGTWQGSVAFEGSGAVLFSTPFDGRWRLTADGQAGPGFRAYGWAQGFGVTFPSDAVRIDYTGGWLRAVEITALAVLWAAALWVTRVRAAPRPTTPSPRRSEHEPPGERVPVEAAS